MKINWKEVCKFVSGAAFADSAVNAVLYFNNTQVSVFGFTQPRELWGIRIVLQFALFLITFYYGFLQRNQ